jgi:molybdenum cofactor cytidylyltransferase
MPRNVGPRAPVVLVLSGGASEHWGGGPKAMLSAGGGSALERIVEVSLGAGMDEIHLVVGAHADEVSASAAELDVGLDVIRNPDWARGRTTAVQCGLRAVEPDRDVLLWPADHPLVRESTVLALRECAATDLLATWIIPEYGGRGGQPVLLKAPAWEHIFSLGPDEPLRFLHARLGPQVRRLAVDDPAVVPNLDPAESQSRSHALVDREEIE